MSTVFSLSLLAVVPIWVLLFLGPGWAAGLGIVREPWLYAPLAVLYVVLVAGTWPSFAETFSSPGLASVAAFVATERGATIGWVHWLVFDAFVGRWMVLDARDRRVPHAAVLPCLLLTLFAGPAGLAAYLGVRTVAARRTAAPAP